MRVKNFILLCGYSRSGTTWMSKLLDSVPSVYLVSEPDKRINRYLQLGNVPHCVTPTDRILHDVYRKGISELLGRIDCNLISFPFFKKNYISVNYTLYRFTAFILKAFNSLFNDSGRKSFFLPKFFLKKNHVDIDFVWKSVNQSSNLDFLINAFPEIKIIYLLRNPYAAITSTLQNQRTNLDGQEFRRILERRGSRYFQNRDVNLRKITFWEEIEKRALLWQIECENAIETGKNYEFFRMVLYEDLAENPTRVMEEIFNWLNWDQGKQTESFLLQSTGRKKPPTLFRAFGSGFFGVYRKPGGNIQGWKNKLSNRDYKLISDVIKTSPLLEHWPSHQLKK